MAGAFVSPDLYITHFPSSNGRVIEFYKHSDGRQFVVRLNNKLVAVAYKELAFEWLRALMKPEYYTDIAKLYNEV